MKRLALVAALLAGIVGTAQAASTSKTDKAAADKNGNACMFISSIGQYRALDRDKVVIWGPGRRHAYLVELTMPLFGLESSWQMATVDHDRDGRLCGFSMDRIGVRDVGRPESATIKSMTRLDEADLAALEEQYKVSLTRKKKDEEKKDEEKG
jgi:hypothetical protein